MLEALRQSRLLHLNERVRAELAERTSLQQVLGHATHPRSMQHIPVRARACACVRCRRHAACRSLRVVRFASPRVARRRSAVVTTYLLPPSCAALHVGGARRHRAGGDARAVQPAAARRARARAPPPGNSRKACSLPRADTRRAACVVQRSMRRTAQHASDSAACAEHGRERYAPVWACGSRGAWVAVLCVARCTPQFICCMLHGVRWTLHRVR